MSCAVDHETDLLARCEAVVGRVLAAQGDGAEPELRRLQAELAETLAARGHGPALRAKWRAVGENFNRKGPNQ